MSATALPTIPRRGARGAAVDAVVMFGRNLRRYQRQPQIAVFVFVQPVMFVLLFRYVFGNSIALSDPSVDYVDYLMPGIFVQTAVFGAAGTGIGSANARRLLAEGATAVVRDAHQRRLAEPSGPVRLTASLPTPQFRPAPPLPRTPRPRPGPRPAGG